MSAQRSFEGDDYSYAWRPIFHELRPCGMDSDGKVVHGDYSGPTGSNGEVANKDAANDRYPDNGNWEGVTP